MAPGPAIAFSARLAASTPANPLAAPTARNASVPRERSNHRKKLSHLNEGRSAEAAGAATVAEVGPQS